LEIGGFLNVEAISETIDISGNSFIIGIFFPKENNIVKKKELESKENTIKIFFGTSN